MTKKHLKILEFLEDHEDMYPRHYMDSDIINIFKYSIAQWCVIRRKGEHIYLSTCRLLFWCQAQQSFRRSWSSRNVSSQWRKRPLFPKLEYPRRIRKYQWRHFRYLSTSRYLRFRRRQRHLSSILHHRYPEIEDLHICDRASSSRDKCIL